MPGTWSNSSFTSVMSFPVLSLAVDQENLTRLLRHRELALRIEVGARNGVFDVPDDIRHLRLVELLHVAEPLHPSAEPVGDDVQVAPARTACAYCWRTFPKNSVLSLISSVYLTFVPYFFSNPLSVLLLPSSNGAGSM